MPSVHASTKRASLDAATLGAIAAPPGPPGGGLNARDASTKPFAMRQRVQRTPHGSLSLARLAHATTAMSPTSASEGRPTSVRGSEIGSGGPSSVRGDVAPTSATQIVPPRRKAIASPLPGPSGRARSASSVPLVSKR